MRRMFPALVALLVSATVFAQKSYETIVEQPNEKTLKGFISNDILQKDTSFTKWYNAGLKPYTPNPDAVKGMKALADSIQFVVFMGTWCEDSHFIIPKFFALAKEAGFRDERITLIGVDRKKTTFGHLTEALNVKNVPTIIVYQNGNEIGRVVEYGKTGLFDKDLAEILNLLSKRATLAPTR